MGNLIVLALTFAHENFHKDNGLIEKMLLQALIDIPSLFFTFFKVMMVLYFILKYILSLISVM